MPLSLYFLSGAIMADLRWLILQSWDGAHQQLGTALVALAALQPILGLIHHHHYLKTHQSHHTFRWVMHAWHGRGLVVMGIINVGLGLRMADNYELAEMVAYICIAGVMAGLYAFMVVMDAVREFRAERRLRKESREPGHISQMSSSHSRDMPEATERAAAARNTEQAVEDGHHAPRVGFAVSEV